MNSWKWPNVWWKVTQIFQNRRGKMKQLYHGIPKWGITIKIRQCKPNKALLSKVIWKQVITNGSKLLRTKTKLNGEIYTEKQKEGIWNHKQVWAKQIYHENQKQRIWNVM